MSSPDPRLLWLGFKSYRNAVKEVGDLDARRAKPINFELSITPEIFKKMRYDGWKISGLEHKLPPSPRHPTLM